MTNQESDYTTHDLQPSLYLPLNSFKLGVMCTEESDISNALFLWQRDDSSDDLKIPVPREKIKEPRPRSLMNDPNSYAILAPTSSLVLAIMMSSTYTKSSFV